MIEPHWDWKAAVVDLDRRLSLLEAEEESGAEPLDMFLCEASRLVLKPQAYRFRVDPDCEACLRAERESRGEVNAPEPEPEEGEPEDPLLRKHTPEWLPPFRRLRERIEALEERQTDIVNRENRLIWREIRKLEERVDTEWIQARRRGTMARDDGGPAFPEPERWAGKEHGPYTEGHGYRHTGMTLRDYFAGQALAGMISHSGWPSNAHGGEGLPASEYECAAHYAYGFADAMLAERTTTPVEPEDSDA